MELTCPAADFYQRKVDQHGVKRRMLIYFNTDDNLIGVVIETLDDKVMIITGTVAEEEKGVYSHKFEFHNATYEEVCKDPLTYIDAGLAQHESMTRMATQGSA